MARVARSTSADASRLAPRNAAKRWSKSALFLSRRTGMAAFWSAFRRHSGLNRRPMLNGAAAHGRQPLNWGNSGLPHPLHGHQSTQFHVVPRTRGPITPGLDCCGRHQPHRIKRESAPYGSRRKAGTTTTHASSPEGSASSPRSLVPRSSAPRSASSHSRHSTSSRSAPPWLNSSTTLPPGGSAG